jgi:hypothetical protein
MEVALHCCRLLEIIPPTVVVVDDDIAGEDFDEKMEKAGEESGREQAPRMGLDNKDDDDDDEDDIEVDAMERALPLPPPPPQPVLLPLLLPAVLLPSAVSLEINRDNMSEFRFVSMMMLLLL